MSKRKTKQAHRELKRDKAKKQAVQQRKAARTSSTTTRTPNTAKAPPTKKHKPTMPSSTSASKPTAPTQASQKARIPFGPYDHILLVGEGDFSFTRALVCHHGCANVTATSYDSAAAVREKYPTFSAIHAEVTALTPPVPLLHDIDASKVSAYKALRCAKDADDDDDVDTDDTEALSDGWDVIAFMFPHTGGLSTHVNRQVRANQALLVAFFKACLETHTPRARLARLAAQRTRGPVKPRKDFLRMGGRIVVTLFEGEPYTLWNIRDLARHAGLKVVESWRFDAEQYPGYAHVRTLGALEGGGAWKGEEREARMYVFEKVELVPDSDEEKELGKMGLGKHGKRERGEKEKESKKRQREDSEDEG